MPFGGGIDSIVTVEQVRRLADVALFVVSRPADRFDAIEQPAAVTGLQVVRAEREIDPQLLRSAELGFLNGHVPVTGILSAIAVLAAVLEDRDAVVMSNEWSASVPTLEYQGRPVNHQFSKSEHVRGGLPGRAGAAARRALPEYFSWLRDRTELWVGQEFAALEPYHGSFRSCNKAFYTERARRLDHWCGQCDKCCFIDLILAPFLPAEALRRIFAVTGEPLEDPRLAAKFRSLLGAGAKPFECVGEVTECRAAVLLAARREDRAPARRRPAAGTRGRGGRLAGRAVRRGRRRHAPARGAELHPGGVPVSRPKLSWSDLAGARVGVWGLGREGHANLRKLLTLGVEPVLVDDQPPAPSRRRAARARHRRRRPRRPRAVRRGGQDAGPEPLPAGGGPADRARHPGGGRPGPVARRSGPAPGPGRDRHQGQEHHLLGHRPPAGRPGLPVHGRRQHRRPAV